MQYAATFGFPVWLQPQDPHLAKGGVAHDGAVAARLGLAGIPVVAETIALATLLQLARETGVRLHLTRISSAAGLDMIRAARAGGHRASPATSPSITCICARTTSASSMPTARLDPPLRAQRDRDALRAGLADGTIDALCSDHTPVDDDAKQAPFAEAEARRHRARTAAAADPEVGDGNEGAADHGAGPRHPRPRRASSASRPARLAPGAAADICVFDPTHASSSAAKR